MDESLYIAVDLGAGSGRVFVAGLAPGECSLEEVRRFHYPPSRQAGHLRWDVAKIIAEIQAGARAAGERAREVGRPIRSLGVDSWAVDYGLLSADGNLLEDPICYRDERTREVMETVFATVTRDEIFARTGIQFLPFNTLFQLYAHAREGMPATAARLLLIPDLINRFLTGTAVTEYTNATTTQMVYAETRDWDAELLERLRLPLPLLARIVAAGTDLGALSPTLAEELGLKGVRVVAPATHDTASAVVGTPLASGWAYISSGTWSLVGVERESPLINPNVARYNFTNEGGVCGTVRFLKNVMGLWLLESCRKEWRERGFDVDYDRLLSEVEAREDCAGLIFADDPRFLNPPSMLDAIAEQLAESGQPMVTKPGDVARVILDSLALRYASILSTLPSLTGEALAGVHIIGGGSRNDYLNQATATATSLPVYAGPVEATVTGNALVQAMAAGRFASLAEARRHIAETVQVKKYLPRPSPVWQTTARRYAEIEARFEQLS